MGKIISNGIEYGGSSIINEINGVFIDTNNIIIPLTEYKPSMSYTATEDCYAILYTVFGSNTAIRINSEIVGNFDGSGNLGITNNFYLKNGQTISVANASSSYNSYYIIYGVQQGSQDTAKNEIYSTEERAVGTWIDGSTIYQKTFELATAVIVSDNTWTSTGISKGDVDKIISCEGMTSDGTCWSDLCATSNVNSYINLLTGRNGDTEEVKYFTIQYTKTTT